MAADSQQSITLGQIADELGAELRGDPAIEINGLATIESAAEGQLTFLSNGFYRRYLSDTSASAVLLGAELADECSVSCLVVDNPYLAYARLSSYFDNAPHPAPGIHSSAVVAGTAVIHPDASIGANCTIMERASIGAGVIIDPGCVIGEGSVIGDNSRLWSNVTVYHKVTIGREAIVHSGVVIGADGFGFAPGETGWEKIRQLGGVTLGDRVEIGAGTTIDRGALEDTRLGNGVKIDNQVQIAHNVVIGENTAIAGCTAIAGSTKIGKNCTIAGAVGITGHLQITDNVHITAMTLVSKSIREPGAYSSGTVMATSGEWKKNAVRFGQLDALVKRVAALEKALESQPGTIGGKGKK
jgi:UDP-3-O-[3-hydroxymyristoyl] glucosamine N-acyltransferase